MKTSNLFKYGNILIKYKLNVANTKHLFCIEYNGLFYEFIMLNGQLVNRNDKAIDDFVKGKKNKGKHFDEYYKSTLNLVSNFKIFI